MSQSHVAELGEGPYWDGKENELYYVDAPAGEFYRLNAATKSLEKRNLSAPGLVTMILPYQLEPGNFLVSQANKLFKLNWTTGATTPVAEVSAELAGRERFNDAKCDPRGRLVIGTVLQSPAGWPPVPNGGALYRLEGTNFVKLSEGFTISNGMAWSNDAKASKLYFNDSEGRKIYVFDYDIETGNVGRSNDRNS